MNTSSTHFPFLVRSVNDAELGPSQGSTPLGHLDLHDIAIVQTHAHFHSFMPFEEKTKLLAMHEASKKNAGWYVLCVLVIYFGALALLLKRKGYLSRHHYQYCCPTLVQYCCMDSPSPTFGSPDGDEHELQYQSHLAHASTTARGGCQNRYSTSSTSINTNVVSNISPGPSTTALSPSSTVSKGRQHPQVVVRVLEPREPIVQEGRRASTASFGRNSGRGSISNGNGSNGTMSTNV